MDEDKAIEAAMFAAKKWFYSAFEDDLLAEMERHGLIAQAEGFSLSCIAELSTAIETAITNKA